MERKMPLLLIARSVEILATKTLRHQDYNIIFFNAIFDKGL